MKSLTRIEVKPKGPTNCGDGTTPVQIRLGELIRQRLGAIYGSRVRSVSSHCQIET